MADISPAWQQVMTLPDDVGLPVIVEWLAVDAIDPVPSHLFAAVAYMTRHGVHCVNPLGCSFGYGGPPKIEIDGAALNRRLGVLRG